MFFKRTKRADGAKTSARAASVAVKGDQKRGLYRAHVRFALTYAVVGRAGSRSAMAVDLSGGGLRMTSDEDLVLGTLVDLSFTLPDSVLDALKTEKEEIEVTPFGDRPKKTVVPAKPFEPMRVRAKTIVTFFNVNAACFEYGLSFHDIDPRVQEEIQRWIHGWQLLHIRNRLI